MADEPLHPLFTDGLPADFRTNAVLKALASADAGSADLPPPQQQQQQQPLAPTAGAGVGATTVVDLPPSPAAAGGGLSRARSGKYRDHLAAKARARVELRAPYSRAQARAAGVLRGAPRMDDDGGGDDGPAAAAAAAPAAVDADGAELALLMRVWKPTTAAGDASGGEAGVAGASSAAGGAPGWQLDRGPGRPHGARR